ncbi:MAG TPA: hypothetical protein VIM14_04970 [Polyangia bacterium]
MEVLRLEPLVGQALPSAVALLATGALPAKLMALRGMAPLRPAELLVAAYQLSFDADAAVKGAAEAVPANLPDRIVLGPLGDALPAQVLHFFAERLPPARHQAIEKILFNQATSDETFVHLAKHLDEGRLEIIFQNEVRLLRCPALVEALYFNKNARMSSASRALELCARNGVHLDGIPGFVDMAAAIMADPNAVKPSVTDEVFSAVLAQGDSPAPAEAIPGGGRASVAEEDASESKRKSSASFIKFDELKIFEKIRLATIGNAYCRQVLIRDSNRLVAMSVVRSPAITDGEIVAAAANRAVCDDVIRFIAGSREHTKDYAVKQALVNNPKCPLAASLRLLSFLRPDDLKSISRSRNIPGTLAMAAKKLLQTRDKSGGS